MFVNSTINSNLVYPKQSIISRGGRYAQNYTQPTQTYIQPSQIRPSYIQPSQIRPTYVQPSQIRPTYVQPLTSSYIAPTSIVQPVRQSYVASVVKPLSQSVVYTQTRF